MSEAKLEFDKAAVDKLYAQLDMVYEHLCDTGSGGVAYKLALAATEFMPDEYAGEHSGICFF
jgi:hypothetical protein